MEKKLFILAALSGALAVGLGAFGAHGLAAFLEATGKTHTFETAVKYQFYHTFALLVCAWLAFQTKEKLLLNAGMLFLAGIIIFSGSLYLIVFTGVRWLGAITPIGGLAMIGGWLLLAVAAKKIFHK